MTNYTTYRTQSPSLTRLARWMEEAEDKFMSDEHGELKVFACFAALLFAAKTLGDLIIDVAYKFGLIG
jgi:hypothetical protein